MNSTNNLSARATYENAKKLFFASWLPDFLATGKGSASDLSRYVDSMVLSQNEVRLEVLLNTTNNVFRFGVTPQQASSNGNVFNTEKRLELQDSMVVSEYGIFVAAPASAVDTAFKLNTYGNLNVFATGAANLNGTLYSNGNLRVTVNNQVVIPNRGLYNHLYIPETQQIAALGAAAVASQIRGAQDGFVTNEPNFLIVGSKNTVPEILLPSTLAAVDAFTRAVLIFRGLTAQNSTVVN